MRKPPAMSLRACDGRYVHAYCCTAVSGASTQPESEAAMTEPTQPDPTTPLGEPSLRLPRPAVRGLVSAGVTTLGAAWDTSDRALLACHGVGPKAVRIIRRLQKDPPAPAAND
jgi:hypothetical protein